MDYHLSSRDWQIISWIGLFLVGIVFLSSLSSNQESEKSSATNHSTTSKSKDIKSKSKGSETVKIKKSPSKPEASESASPEPTESKSEFYFDWPPNVNSKVSGEGGATIVGNWQQVPGNEHWYYLTEENWDWCGGGSSWCQSTWWVSDEVCERPTPYAKSTQINGVSTEYEYFAGAKGPYMTPHKAVLGLYVLVPWSENYQIVDKVIPDKYKYAVLSMSCS